MEDDKTAVNDSLGCVGGNSNPSNNCISTASSGYHDPLMQNALSITLLSTLLGLMTICGVVGNVLVILSVALMRKLRTVTNCFIVSLAVADLLVAVFVMPISAFVEVTGEWWFGPLVCWIFISADVFLCTSSIWNLLIISLERFMAINFPLWYGVRRTKRLALYLIAVAWIVSLGICIPPLFVHGIFEGAMTNGQCSYAIDEGYRIYSACGSFWIPLAIILFCYVRIFSVANNKDRILRKSKMRNGSLAPGETSSPSTAKDPDHHHHHPANNGFIHETFPIRHSVVVRASSITETNLTSSTALIEIRLEELSSTSASGRNDSIGFASDAAGALRKFASMRHTGHFRRRLTPKDRSSFKERERKVFRVLLIILCSFVACWMGFFVIYTLEPFVPALKEIDKRIYAFFLWLGYFNSMLNPLIYAGFSQEFRSAFVSILCCQCFMQKKKKKITRSIRTHYKAANRVKRIPEQ
ncbi:hypothetical protein RvY_10648 [Ramazzottius varieornatus]|uniref:G-protein coupled receptors family 1 profile domain-containing protein n=1 Tax=Ramazzottius varieornatus TaxID=947166 RepID=A0A1D1VIV0_RAMVA|nr:hypothetical protein RvY_10648 [Ramazzottius varieornatus]